MGIDWKKRFGMQLSRTMGMLQPPLARLRDLISTLRFLSVARYNCEEGDSGTLTDSQYDP